MSKLPAVAWVCITAVILAVLGSLTYLSAIGADTTEIQDTMSVLFQLGTLALAGVGATAGAYAAVNARKAADQTNGDLDRRLVDAVREGTDQR